MATLTNNDYFFALNAWKDAKSHEKIYNSLRLEAEDNILKIVNPTLPKTGTTHLEGDLKIVTGLDSKWSDELLHIAHGEFISTGTPFPFEITWKPDNKAIETIRLTHPDLYKRYLLPALTIKPKKPSFSIKE